MAMMARTLGIPSRVVVGFLTPSRQDNDGSYVFTSHDAHAWPELYFGGIGWVRFEPTPGNGATIPGYTHRVNVPAVVTGGGPTSAPGTVGHASQEVPTTTGPTARQHSAGGPASGGGVPPLAWLVILVVIALAFTPALIRIGVRRSRLARAIDGGPSCEHAWLELRDRILDLRLPWTGSLTPRARRRFVEPLVGGDPDAVAALDRLSLTVERARYAAAPVPGADPAGDARDIITAVTRAVDRKRRFWAFWWPASLMPEIRLGWAHLRARFHRAAPSET
jgi:hypothetical protein